MSDSAYSLAPLSYGRGAGGEVNGYKEYHK